MLIYFMTQKLPASLGLVSRGKMQKEYGSELSQLSFCACWASLMAGDSWIRTSCHLCGKQAGTVMRLLPQCALAHPISSVKWPRINAGWQNKNFSKANPGCLMQEPRPVEKSRRAWAGAIHRCASPGRVTSPEVVSKNVADSVKPAEIRELCSRRFYKVAMRHLPVAESVADQTLCPQMPKVRLPSPGKKEKLLQGNCQEKPAGGAHSCAVSLRQKVEGQSGSSTGTTWNKWDHLGSTGSRCFRVPWARFKAESLFVFNRLILLI